MARSKPVEEQKANRLVRLLRLINLVQSARYGLTPGDLADRLEVSVRTVQRDIRALESYMLVPFYIEGNRYLINPRFFLPPLNLSLQEAVGLLLGARLMLRYADKADGFTAGAYEKLAGILPKTVGMPLLDAAAGLGEKRVDEAYSKVVSILATAWAERRKVTIRYASEGKRAADRTVWPLFLEPSAIGHCLYLLAWDEGAKGMRVFKVERIAGAEIRDATFKPPRISLAKHLGTAWTIWSSTEPMEVELAFSRRVAARVRETVWHPSQEVADMPDGRLQLRFRVGAWLEIRHWVLGWGEDCEVIAPAPLRASIRTAVMGLARTYGSSTD
jgi:predicted DNA-binding transcriptional regulator YafY